MKLFERTIKEILRPLTKNNISYCIIGGLAVISSGVRRGTADFDIIIDETKLDKALEIIYRQKFKLITDINEKKEKLYFRKTLNQAIAYVKFTSPDALKINKGGFNGLFGDIWLKDTFEFEKIRKDSSVYTFYNERVYIAGIDDLIKLKKSAGRPVDKEDVYELKLIKKKFKKNKNV